MTGPQKPPGPQSVSIRQLAGTQEFPNAKGLQAQACPTGQSLSE
jgi:hypothetical protein